MVGPVTFEIMAPALTRVVLTEPFMKYPAGTVFELPESEEPSGWHPDERARERLSFLDKRALDLPDMGRGRATTLPMNITRPCPPEVFENKDLSTGPCRVTAVATGTGPELLAADSLAPPLQEAAVSLLDLGGQAAQGLRVALADTSVLPVKTLLFDRLNRVWLGEMPVPASEIESGALDFDFSELSPGFYAVDVVFSGDFRYRILFIKSFPLLVMIDRSGRYSLQKTLY